MRLGRLCEGKVINACWNLAVCPVPFNSARAIVALGSWLVEGTKYVCRQGLLRMDLLLTAVGVAKWGRISGGALFYNGHHVIPRDCWCSVKQDHQFLNKILTCLHGPMSTPTDLFFKILKFSGPSLPGMTTSTLQPLFLSEVLLWQLWLSYPLRASVKLYPMTVHLN